MQLVPTSALVVPAILVILLDEEIRNFVKKKGPNWDLTTSTPKIFHLYVHLSPYVKKCFKICSNMSKKSNISKHDKNQEKNGENTSNF